MTKIATLLVLLCLQPPRLWAASAEDCFEAYSNFSAGSAAIGASSLGLSALVFLSTSGVGITAATAGLVGSTFVANSIFEKAVAESILEAQANVVGPFTIQLAHSLNHGVYEFKPDELQSVGSSWASETRELLVMTLNGRKITPEQIAAATREMIRTGRMCLIRGNAVHTLDDAEWAKRVVGYVARNPG